jgi:hypothetical protein
MLIIAQTVIPALLPLHLFKVLQTPSSKKRNILVAFAFPLVYAAHDLNIVLHWLTRHRNVVTLIVMLWSYTSSMNNSPDGTGLVGLEICLQVLLGWSLICPTIPCMRSLAMRFTTGGAIVFAGEEINSETVPSTLKSHTNPRGFRKRRSYLTNFPKQLEQDELELNPRKPDRPTSTIRTSDGDGQGSMETCTAGPGGNQVSRRYEVFTEEIRSKSEFRNMAIPASVEVGASH